jgi:hypothetical protein
MSLTSGNISLEMHRVPRGLCIYIGGSNASFGVVVIRLEMANCLFPSFLRIHRGSHVLLMHSTHLYCIFLANSWKYLFPEWSLDT